MTSKENDVVPTLSNGYDASNAQSQSSSTPCSPSKLNENENDLIKCKVKKYKWEPPADAINNIYESHQGEGSQYLRDFILGVNDGLISTFLVVVSVVGGGASTLLCLLAGISATIAGSMAMGIGEYIATKSQAEVTDTEVRLETNHFKYHRDVEIAQLRSFLSSVKLKGDLLEAVVCDIAQNDEKLMKMMLAFEFGVQEDLERNPIKAMFMSGRLYFIGSLPTVAPFFATSLNSHIALAIAAGLVAASLFIVGAYKTRTTRGVWWYDGLENFLLGACATGISYAVGVAFDQATG